MATWIAVVCYVSKPYTTQTNSFFVWETVLYLPVSSASREEQVRPPFTYLLICVCAGLPAQRRRLRLLGTGNGNEFMSYRVVIGVGV